MKALEQLERAGYAFSLTDDGAIGYAYLGIEPPDGSQTRTLLAEIQQRRVKVSALLAARKAPSKAGEPFTTKTRCHVIFPAETRLPFPAGSWRRLADGRIEAHVNYEELQLMRLWRDEVLP